MSGSSDYVRALFRRLRPHPRPWKPKAHHPHVDGYHGGCPARTKTYARGTYALVRGPGEQVGCHACGEPDLAPVNQHPTKAGRS